jgi:hypothetical protein
MVNNKLLVLAQKPNQGAAFLGSAEENQNQIIVAAGIGLRLREKLPTELSTSF